MRWIIGLRRPMCDVARAFAYAVGWCRIASVLSGQWMVGLRMRNGLVQRRRRDLDKAVSCARSQCADNAEGESADKQKFNSPTFSKNDGEKSHSTEHAEQAAGNRTGEHGPAE